MNSDTTAVISRSANRFFTGTMLSRITGMVRDMAMAFAFGTSAHVAAFLMALRFAHLFRRILGEGALQSAFVPIFEGIRHEDPREAYLFFRDLVGTLSAILVGLIIIGGMTIGAILLFAGITPSTREVLYLTLLMLPSLLFICLFGVNASLMQCEKSFFTPSIAPVAFNLIWIAAIFSLHSLEPKSAMPPLAAFMTLACMGQWGVTLPKTCTFCLRIIGRSFWRGVSLFSREVRRVAKPLSLAVIGVAATQINSAMDVIFARVAEPQGPAFLWYAIRIQQLPIGLFGVALAGALLPPLSRAIKQNNLNDYRHFLSYACKRNLAIMIPCTAALILLGAPGINLVFGHGHFDSLSTAGTTWCLWGYSLGILPMTLVMIFAPAYYAKGNYSTPIKASLTAVIVNVLLNTWLITYWHLGAASVAVATSISSWVNLAILGYGLAKDVGWSAFSAPLKQTRRLTVMSLTATILAFVVMVLSYGWATLPLITGIGTPSFPQEFTGQLAFFVTPATTFLAILLLTVDKKQVFD